MGDLVKQDINFLEYPLWMQDERSANEYVQGYTWTDREGYIYKCGYKPPTKIDIIFLLYFLSKSQQNNWNDKVIISKYEILKKCDLETNDYYYDRLMDSLRRWKMLTIEFQGTFYDGKHYKPLLFGVIDDSGYNDITNDLVIHINEKWLLKIKESTFYKIINFEQIKALRSSLAIRLYEILVKNFQTRTTWEIDSMKLAHKIPMKEDYPADVIAKIKPAVVRINKKTDLNLKLGIRRPERGKAILTFDKMASETTPKQLPVPVGLPEDDTFKKLNGLLPKEHQVKKTIIEVLSKAYRTHGFEYVKWNIEYINKNYTSNYRAYLVKALKENWGAGLREDEESRKRMADDESKAIAIKKQKEKQEAELMEKQKERRIKAEEYVEKLLPDELTELRTQAINALAPEMQKNLKKDNALFEKAVELNMCKIALQRLS